MENTMASTKVTNMDRMLLVTTITWEAAVVTLVSTPSKKLRR